MAAGALVSGLSSLGFTGLRERPESLGTPFMVDAAINGAGYLTGVVPGKCHRGDAYLRDWWTGLAPRTNIRVAMELSVGGVAPSRRRLSELAALSPSHRDRYVDFLRGLSILFVVLGHWLGSVIEWRDGRLIGTSALDVVPGLWIITWLFQVMPIFFFVGGFANLVTYAGLQRLGEGAGTFLRGRANRLLRPVAIFLVFWGIVTPFALRIPGLPEEASSLAVPVLLGPLWFLIAYMALVATSVITVPLHSRYGVRLLLVLGLLPVAVDLVRFVGHVPGIGWANFLFVWLFIHQLGFFYADGTFARVPRRFFWLMTVGGFVVMVALTQLRVYPASMVGCCGDRISNMAPPTLPIMALGVWQVGLTMLLRPAVSRWLAKPGPWKAVVAVNGSIMTLYLWHLSALVVAGAILVPLGFLEARMGSALWWSLRPVWIAAMTTVLVGLVFLWGRFERPDLDPAERYWNLAEFYAL